MINLEQLPNKKLAVVIKVDGGKGLKNKMSCLNIREGKIIKKIMSQPFNGPVIIQVDNRQCALGRGMARKIMVEEK